jgi:Na+/H+ antiporter NhaC
MVAAGLGLFAAPLLAADATTVADSPPAAVPYGGWVLAPAVSAILLAILTRQVVPSLFLGVLVASFMMWRTQAAADAGVAAAVVGTMRQAVEVYLVEAAADPDHVKVMLFTLIIGGMVGVVGQSGGTAALVGLIARRASSPRHGQLTAWAAGLVVFFDDYANTMIVGPTMQPICDRLRISRAKLAYIVDSTAAPVASIALVGTWVGAELDFIREGLNAVAAAGTPEFLAGVNAWQAFVRSIPYRFYAVLAIVHGGAGRLDAARHRADAAGGSGGDCEFPRHVRPGGGRSRSIALVARGHSHRTAGGRDGCGLGLAGMGRAA